jgi:2-C-methyl-D-erythritol 4-phosphate cytidylyltransferase / 2-C-methyl-D-erythritol 2,4-cyclodiphosphate synthase
LTQPPNVSLIVVAAGRGSRVGGAEPKQYRLCAGRPLLCHTLEALAAAYDFFETTVVIHPNDRTRYDEVVALLSPECARTLGAPTDGGATRQESVLAGLEAQAARTPDLALIHDGARAFPSKSLIGRAIVAAERYGAAAPGTPLNDTVKEIDAAGLVVATPSRAALRAVQTPQSFRFDLILDAHRRAIRAGIGGLTDDAAIAEWAGHPCYIFEGDPDNGKVTTLRDLAEAEVKLANQAADIRVGQGFDVHAFVEGDHLCLGGIDIPHSHALSGHSDADVVLHAITDALLGAIGDGDIGAHFPPSDNRWKGAASRIFLEDARRRVLARGGLIAHIDATLICEAPKIGPFRGAMRARIAEIARLDIDRVGVKATTSERLGFTGRGEGIACLATATVRLPWRHPS